MLPCLLLLLSQASVRNLSRMNPGSLLHSLRPSWKEAASLVLGPGWSVCRLPLAGPDSCSQGTHLPLAGFWPLRGSRTLLQWGSDQSSPILPPPPSWAEVWLPHSAQPVDSLKQTAAWPPVSLTPCQTYYTCQSSKGLEDLRFPFGFCGRLV